MDKQQSDYSKVSLVIRAEWKIKDAIETLEQIKNPPDEIIALISNLKNCHEELVCSGQIFHLLKSVINNTIAVVDKLCPMCGYDLTNQEGIDDVITCPSCSNEWAANSLPTERGDQ